MRITAQLYFFKKPLPWLLLAFLLCCALVFPLFRDVIDPDDTAYFRIAQRYAAADFANAVNGMWSPLNSWLAAPFMAAGGSALAVFRCLNMASGLIVLAAAGRLFQKAGVDKRWLFCLLPFAVYATFHEGAADWLFCAVALLYLNLIFSAQYRQRKTFPLWCGVLGAMLFYARYYGFHCFWLHFLVANFFAFFDFGKRRLSPKFWSWMLAGILPFLLLSLPWALLMHRQYGQYMLCYTGAIDMSWNMSWQTAWAGRQLLPPTRPGAASYWEDPWWIQQRWLSPFSGWAHFKRQVVICLAACWSLLTSMLAGSVLLPAVWLRQLWLFITGGFRREGLARSVMLTGLVLPLGYLLFHVEPRFIWVLWLLGFLLGIVWLRPLQQQIWLRLFALSFMAYPIIWLAQNAHRDAAVFRTAALINPLQLSGNFISNGDQDAAMRLAYLTNTGFCAVRNDSLRQDALLDELIRQRVHYYFHYQHGSVLIPAAICRQLSVADSFPTEGFVIYRLY